MSEQIAQLGIRVTERGRVVEVVLDAPPVNAISVAMYEELTRLFRGFSARTDIHAVLIYSALARGFSAGADIKEDVQGQGDGESAAERRQRLARECYEAILDCAVPTIAVVHGFALGAGSVIPACCDIRIGADDASIGLPEINAGRCGGGRHLMRLIPQGTTRLMYFTGDPMDAEEAFRVGYLQAVHPRGRVVDEARSLADRIAAKSPLGLRLAKRALNESEALDVRAGYRQEQEYTLQLGAHPDAVEAAASTLERRAPVWTWGA